MRPVAVLLDGGFILKRMRRLLGNAYPTADHVVEFAKQCLAEDEDLFRIYYYDCLPYGGTERHPLTKREIDYSETPTGIRQTKFLRELARKKNVAFRAGEIMFSGWFLKWKAKSTLDAKNIKEEDLEPDIKQKGVDIKIGLDVAWLASNRIVERIILVTSDSDLVPAMKFARRAGVQVVLVTMGYKQIKKELKIHADEVRDVTFP